MERIALKAAVAVAGLVPVSAGLGGALQGADLVDGAGVSLDSHVRYLSGLLLGIGLAYWAMVPTIERRGLLFGTLAAIVVLGGLFRLLGLALVREPPNEAMQLALVMELVVTPALALWQRRVAKRAAPERRPSEP